MGYYNKTGRSDDRLDALDIETTAIDGRVTDIENKAVFDQINVKDHGATGLGLVDDSSAIQDAYDSIYLTGGEIFFPEGTYLISTPIRTYNETDSFTQGNTVGVTFKGAGKGTIITGSAKAVVTYSDYDISKNECLFGVHSSNNAFRDMQFINCKNAIYIGQDPRDPTAVVGDATHAHLNKFSDLFFEDCGTGVLMQPGYGSYYNQFRGLKFQGCEIGVHLGLPPYIVEGGNPPVNNRNSFQDMYFNNGWCGFLIENGDTGLIKGANFESLTTGDFTCPTQIADGNATGIYTNDAAHYYGISGWKVSDVHCEANTRDLYYYALGWSFFNCLFEMSTKVDIHASATIGSFISTGDYYQNYKNAGTHLGDLHIKHATATVDPFLPNVGATEQGIMVGLGRIADLNSSGEYLGRAEHDIVTPNGHIETASTTTKSIWWQLGGVKEWFVSASFEGGAALNSTTNLRLFLPDLTQPNALFDKPDITDNYKFPVWVRSGAGALEQTWGWFLVSNNIIDIEHPSYGWTKAVADDNHIYFNLRWFT